MEHLFDLELRIVVPKLVIILKESMLRDAPLTPIEHFSRSLNQLSILSDFLLLDFHGCGLKVLDLWRCLDWLVDPNFDILLILIKPLTKKS